jgi:hypothetical protein
VRALVICSCLALFAWRELATMRADGRTIDEAGHLAYGERALLHGDFARRTKYENSKMPVSVLNALPVVIAQRLGMAPAEAQQLWLARLPTVALGLALSFLVFLWARRLFGFRGGALALLLATCCPNLLAHSHLVTTDVATTLGMFGATFALWWHRQQPSSRWRLALAAAIFGLALLTKPTALFLVPIFAAIALWELARRKLAGGPSRGRPLAAVARPAAALTLGAIAVLNLGFAGDKTWLPLSRYAPVSPPLQTLAAIPVLRDLPLPVPQPYLAGLDMVTRDAHDGTLIYLHGNFSRHGFRSYYLVALLIKTPVGTLLLLAIAAWLAWTGRLRAPAAEGFLLVPALFLFLYLSFAFELQIGLRYLLPALPFLFVFAGRVAAWRPLGSPFGILACLLAAWTSISSLSVHPRYIPYFNELIGGPHNGYHWLADSNLDWSQDSDYVRDTYARRSPVPLWIEPDGPIAGRTAVRLTNLVFRYPWLRAHFEPTALIHDSWALFDLRQEDIDRCCSAVPQAWPIPDADRDLAPAGHPEGAAATGVNLLERLNDRLLGANTEWDAARSGESAQPVQAWFGIAWDQPQIIGRVVAYPGYLSRGPGSRRFLATDYVLQQWDGAHWLDLPGTAVTGNRRLHIEHTFPPIRTTRLRLLIQKERNDQGTETTPATFRAACLELVVYPPDPPY